MQDDLESLLSLPWQELEMAGDVIVYDDSSFLPITVKVPWDAKMCIICEGVIFLLCKRNLQKSVESMQCPGSQQSSTSLD
jgi:hypothetical protein